MEKIYKDDILVLIARKLSRIASTNEETQLKDWINSTPDNKKYFEELEKIWDASDKQIELGKIKVAKALEEVMGRIPGMSSKKTFWHYWQKIAAIMFFPLAIGAFLWNYLNSNRPILSDEIVYNEVYTAIGTRSSLILEDSTLVWLNSGSSLRYPVNFNRENRQVFLKGEGYFEVKSDFSRPFIVKTSSLQVEATGTNFNVRDYASMPLTKITLISGKVFIKKLSDINDPELISELYPNQQLTYNRYTKANSISNEDTYRFTAWKDGKLVFRNESLDQVSNALSIMFNVDIELQGKELQGYRYHATFQDESLEEILKLLRLSAPINFTEVKRSPSTDGSFPKKKVIIYPAKEKLYYK